MANQALKLADRAYLPETDSVKLVLTEAVRVELNYSYSLDFIQEKILMNLTHRFLIVAALCAGSLSPIWAQSDFAQSAAKEPGAKVMASGLVYRSIQDGQGTSPKASDKVKVHYRGTFPDGKEFDSSYKRNQPIDFPLNAVIPCWTEGVQLMKVGGKAKLTCPPAIAYGSRGAGGVIPPNATLQFEVELIAISGQ
jgi:FKBP-type peptidyl-prolyl cis-trans isomerase FkpA